MIDKYIQRLKIVGEHEIAEYLYYLKLERDAAVNYLQEWSCCSCSRRGRKEFCEECARNRVKIARGYALDKDMYKWRTPEEV